MGHVYADLEISNAKTGRRLEVTALVDTGATFLCLPAALATDLELSEVDSRPYALSDGRTGTAPYVGPVFIKVGERPCFGGALVLEGEPLLGVVPMEDLDLVVDPQHRTVAIHPDSTRGPRAFHARRMLG